jgi:LPS sulfotransferase NodH
MLVDVDTGYEGKFDFPRRAAEPDLVYMLASIPRTGSTYLSHALWRTGCLGAPLEYLNFEPSGPYYFASHSPDAQTRLWRSVLHRRASPNGVFGFKCFPVQLQTLGQQNPALLAALRPSRIVYLTRRDRLAHIVSLARATVSGVWRKEQEQAAAQRIHYSEEALEAAERGIAVQEAAWEQMLSDLGIEPLTVWHEDALADCSAVVDAVANYLGVSVDPVAAVEVPEIAKQAEGNSHEWAERYARSRRR